MSATDVIETELLRAEVAHLKEQLAELTGKDLVSAIRHRLGIRPKCAGVLAAITKRGSRLVPHGSIYSAVFEHDNGDGPTMEIIKVSVCYVRKALRDAGAPGQIHNVHGRGYQADQELCDWVRALVQPQEMAA